MGLCSSKNGSSLNTSRCIARQNVDEPNGFRSNTFTDTDRLISPICNNYNSYVLNEASLKDAKYEFKVSRLNDKLRSIKKGYLRITKYELIFSHHPNNNDIISSWNLTTLRWYAYTHNLFLFQCGRKASTGEGTYVFSCQEYRKLKESFEMLLHENYSVNNAQNIARYAKLPYNSHNNGNTSSIHHNSMSTHNILSTESNRISDCFSNMNNHERFNRSHSLNPSCNHSCLDGYSKYRVLPMNSCFISNVDNNNAAIVTRSDETFSSGRSSTATNAFDSRSEMTSSESNISGIGTTTAANYVNGGGLGLVLTAQGIGGGAEGSGINGPEYLVAAGLQTWHGYVNENNTPAPVTSIESPNYLNFLNSETEVPNTVNQFQATS